MNSHKIAYTIMSGLIFILLFVMLVPALSSYLFSENTTYNNLISFREVDLNDRFGISPEDEGQYYAVYKDRKSAPFNSTKETIMITDFDYSLSAPDQSEACEKQLPIDKGVEIINAVDTEDGFDLTVADDRGEFTVSIPLSYYEDLCK